VPAPQLLGTHSTESVAFASTRQLLLAFTVMVTVAPEADVLHEPPVTPPQWFTMVQVTDSTVDPDGQA